ncbi:MAG TPA: hypothetical protein VNA29_02055 [Sphingomicrobium sp.]|nr:hypothetical protein [Sphingomicrobium sp.]
MSLAEDQAFHLERAAQCRHMARESSDPAVRQLHERLAEFHEAEARREKPRMAANEDVF